MMGEERKEGEDLERRRKEGMGSGGEIRRCSSEEAEKRN